MGKDGTEKSRQLGMPIATARSRLVKQIMFSMAVALEAHYCFRCGLEIDNIDELSIEHKVPWLHAENAPELFFDLDNIAFSHLSCNSSASRGNKGKRKRETPEGKNWCYIHKEFLPLEMFARSSKYVSGFQIRCLECAAKQKRDKRARDKNK